MKTLLIAIHHNHERKAPKITLTQDHTVFSTMESTQFMLKFAHNIRNALEHYPKIRLIYV